MAGGRSSLGGRVAGRGAGEGGAARALAAVAGTTSRAGGAGGVVRGERGSLAAGSAWKPQMTTLLVREVATG